jgi:hypothetical protein
MSKERRKARRHEYRCPVWFGGDRETLGRGTLINLSRSGLALIASTTGCHPRVGQVVLMQFSSPSHGPSMAKPLTRTGRVCRVTDGLNGPSAMAVQLNQPLLLEPSELGVVKK